MKMTTPLRIALLAAALFFVAPLTGFSRHYGGTQVFIGASFGHGGCGYGHGGYGYGHGGYGHGGYGYRGYGDGYGGYGYPYYGSGYGYPYAYGPSFGVSYSEPAYYSERTVYRGVPRSDYRDDLASDVQRALSRRGYYRGAIDGAIGSGSRAAIRAYQYDHRLEVTGRIDGALLRSLRIG